MLSAEQTDIALITVHGTNDQDRRQDDPKWWQRSSKFVQALSLRLNLEQDQIKEFTWSGANFESKRRQAAYELIAEIASTKARTIVIVAHSHGGNVVRAALNSFCEGRHELHAQVRVISIGTPFFQYSRYLFLLARRLSGAVALSVLAASAILGGIVFTAMHMPNVSLAWWAIFTALGLITTATFVLLGLFAGFISLSDLSVVKQHAPCADVQWHAISSANDEAIVALNYAANIDRPVMGNWMRGVLERRSKLLWRAAGAICWGAAMFSIATAASGWLTVDANELIGQLGFETAAALLASVGVTVFIIAGYFLLLCLQLSLGVRLLVHGATVAATRQLDRLALMRLADWAYGNDAKPRIVGLSELPWENGGTVEVLNGELHDELESYVVSAFPSTMTKVRGILSGSDALADRSFGRLWEAIAWNEVAHTAYFKNERVAAYLVEQICAKSR